MLQEVASSTYYMAYSTLKITLHSLFTKKQGGSTVFSDVVEQAFVRHVLALSEFGFPVSEYELRFILAECFGNKYTGEEILEASSQSQYSIRFQKMWCISSE